MSKTLSRRSFLKRSVGALAVASLPAGRADQGVIAPSTQEIVAATEASGAKGYPKVLKINAHQMYVVRWDADGGSYRIPIYEPFTISENSPVVGGAFVRSPDYD